MYSIEQIAAYNTWGIRHQVLYPGRPFDLVRLAEDEEGIHFGLFDENKLMTVISTFIRDKEMQFRKFATILEAQRRGYGSAMLRHILDFAKNEGVNRVWCNARTSAEHFYTKFGFSATGEHFIKNDIEYVTMSVMLQ
jgi:GNAT superfamily N-acetyltransferase